MSRINLGHITLHVQELNPEGKETVIMIHGLGYGSLAMWYFNIAPALSSTYRVIMYDQKSHGKSERSPVGYDLQTLSDELNQLMNVLQIESASLVGFSFGAALAMKQALRFPDRVNQLALIEMPYLTEELDLSFLENNSYNKEALDRYRKTLPQKMQNVLAGGKRQLERHDDMFRYLFDETSLIINMANEQDFSEQELMRMYKRTLLVSGKDSAHIPMGYRLHRLLPNAEFIIAEGGHDLPITHPREVSHYLSQFFGIEKDKHQEKVL